jgi:F-type H+-transporting ATPase subunit b
MLIDWFTVGAQVLNFLILVWLLKHFLYKPILNAIDAREKRIAAELADADAKKTEAQKERDDFQSKNKVFDEQRSALLGKAADEAKVERERLLDEARKAAESLRAAQATKLRNDQARLGSEITRLAKNEVFGIARKTLADLATVSLEERVGEVFTRRLREMDGKAKALLGAALKSSSEPAVVRSAFDLGTEQRAAIQNALNETFSAEIRIRFETSPDLISGIELTTNGQKVAWSIADYLASLGKGVDELLRKNDEAAAKTEPKAEAKTEPKAEAKTETKPEVKAEPKAEAKTEPKPEPKAEPKAEAKAEARPEAKAEPKPEAKAEPKPEAKAEPKPEAKAEPKPEAKAEPKPEAKAEPKPEAKAEPKAEVKAEPKPEAKAEPKAEVKAEPKPEVKAEPKPEAKAEPKSEAKAEPKAEVKAEPKPEVKAEPKPEAKAEPTPEAKADSKPEEPKPETVSA